MPQLIGLFLFCFEFGWGWTKLIIVLCMHLLVEVDKDSIAKATSFHKDEEGKVDTIALENAGGRIGMIVDKAHLNGT